MRRDKHISNASHWVQACLFHYERAAEIKARGEIACVCVESTADYLICEHKTFHNRRAGCDTHCQINKCWPDSYFLYREGIVNNKGRLCLIREVKRSHPRKHPDRVLLVTPRLLLRDQKYVRGDKWEEMQVLSDYKVNLQLPVMTYRFLNVQLRVTTTVISLSEKYSWRWRMFCLWKKHQFTFRCIHNSLPFLF